MNTHSSETANRLTPILSCPDCRGPLLATKDYNECQVCSRFWPVIDSIPSFVLPDLKEQRFYETWHQDQLTHKRNGPIRQMGRRIIKPARYFATKRERLFRRVFVGRQRGPILDIGCGIGQPQYCNFGPVTGVDLSLEPLRMLKDRGFYEKVVHADAGRLPFPNGAFSCIVSADFLGHVPISGKDGVISEMSRVLAPGGIMAHVVETDSANRCFRFAHRYPDLFQKYFVEEIGGHYGLEMPTAVVERFGKHGLKVVEVEKMWGPIWDTRQYIAQFGNEYVTYNNLLRAWVFLCRCLSSNPITMITAEATLGLLSNAFDRFQPLDSAQGIFVVVKKT